ncbi:hypothetical protein ROJ8625_03970 [Roseivivax jejudonensis]|uniref:TadE-like protein n=1 Tax=Roseivivax jejudonensis TaxID=1529041 RepID=A0A1X7ABT1_9RHOB|nr:hypothetical protein [Roseivivax jejudonensis]SLN73706.1 hypothetical protein ROJ8625_03970 [Roseivivax jejudonensis]
MTSILKRRFAAFATRENGDVNIEAILALPILWFIFCGVWVWHDASRSSALEQRVNYSVGDMISRETRPLNPEYVDHTYELVLAMLESRPEDTDLRISVVKQTKNIENEAPSYEVLWSESRGIRPELDGYINDMSEKLPLMARNDQIVLVETWTDYEPVFEAGLSTFEISSYSFTRPRFAPQVLFEENPESGYAGYDYGDSTMQGTADTLCNTNSGDFRDVGGWSNCADNTDGSQNIEPSGV